MNILVTGASGFIGKSLVDYLIQKGHFVRALSSSDVDLTSQNSVENFINSNNIFFDVIVHGAFILCDSSQDTNIQMQNFKKNIEITENIVKIAQSINPKKIINLSSMAVYPNIDGIFSETSEIRPSVNPEGIYGLAKFCAENMLDLFLQNQDITISHLRIGQVYGKGMREGRIFSVFKNDLIKGNTIAVFGEGERISSFIEISKLCAITDAFLDKDLGGIYNIGEENLSYYDLAQRTIDTYGNANSKIIKHDKGSRAKFYLDCEKIKNI